mgnify:CR=1 FL=1
MKKPKIRVKNETSFPTLLVRRLARAVWDDRDLTIPLLIELKLWTSKKRQIPVTRSRYSSEVGFSEHKGVSTNVLKIVLYGREDGDQTHEKAANQLLSHLTWNAVWIFARRRQGTDRQLRARLAAIGGEGSGNGTGPDSGIRRKDLGIMSNAIKHRVLDKLRLVPSSGPGQETELPHHE